MNPEVKQLWVTAIRDNVSTQIHGPLRARQKDGTYHYCVIGQLISTYCKIRGKEWKEVVDHDGMIPEDLYNWAGFEGGKQPFVKINDITAYPSIHNDHWKVPFPQIADAIQEQL